MPKGYPTKQCRGCFRPQSECGELSATYLCADCGRERFTENRRNLRDHSGPWFDHWRKRSLAALGVFVPLDADDDTRYG